jgi:hypothetical protein
MIAVQIVLVSLGVAIVGNYAWFILNATESDWQEAKSSQPTREPKDC